MRRIHPLYLIALLVVALLYGIYAVAKEKEALREAQQEMDATMDLAKKLSAYKRAYDPKSKKRLLRSIRSKRSLAHALKIEEKPKRLHISGKSLPLADTNYVLSKVLNGTYNITKLELTKEKADHVDIELEIRW